MISGDIDDIADFPEDGDDNITILFTESDHYGGIYLRGNSMMIITAYDTSSSEIDNMLDMLGLTKP